MNSIRYMSNYGNFKKRIIFAFSEYFLSCAIWLFIDQYLTYSVFDNAIAKNSARALIFVTILVIVKQIFKTSEGIFHCMVRHHLQREYANYTRKDLFYKFINTKISYFDNTNTGEMLELIMNDTENASTFFTQNGLISFGNLCAKLPLLLIILFFINFKLTTILILTYLIGYLSLIISNKKTFKMISEIRELNISITKWITEQINNFELIKSISIENVRLNKMNELIEKYTNESENLDKLIRKYNFAYTLFSFLASIATTCIGGYDLSTSILSYGTLMLFINGTTSIKGYCDDLVTHLPRLNESFVSMKKIYNYLNKYDPEIETGNVQLNKINNIKFDNVCFSYSADRQILNNISIEVNNNDKIAIVGRTGCGKTTLVNLLCRFYEVSEGKIIINGKNIDNYTLESLRDNIGYVMQDVVIFDGNIYDNINYAKNNVSKEQIEEICKTLKLHDKIMSFSEGYELNLSKNQDLFSQGEKQMINFARIMVENPSVIILDEITSSLSYENEELVKNAIKEITKDKICFIIAHRLTTIKSCNKIIYMEHGNILENGTHQELMNRKGNYYNLVKNY